MQILILDNILAPEYIYRTTEIKSEATAIVTANILVAEKYRCFSSRVAYFPDKGVILVGPRSVFRKKGTLYMALPDKNIALIRC